MTLKIRHRYGSDLDRRWYFLKGEDHDWDEWQVVGPRGKILSRHDFKQQAEKWIEDHEDDIEWKQSMGLAQ